MFAPYTEDKGIIALALSDPNIRENEHDRDLIETENARVLALVDTAFDRQELPNLATDPRQLLPPPASMTTELPHIEGKFLTCLVRKEESGEDGRKNIAKLYQLFYNHEAEGATYVMLNMPGGDISEAKYLLPLIDNTIDGYYDIERISFGTRTKIMKDGQSIPNYPTLRIKVGAYHPLDRRYTEGIVPRMANQIWSYSQLRNVMTKSKGYGFIVDEENIVSEPETEYGALESTGSDYIECI